MPVIAQILSELIPFWMNRGMRQEQKETMDLQQEMMKQQLKQQQMNYKQSQQVIDYLNTLPPEWRASAQKHPLVTNLLMSITNRGQEGAGQAQPQTLDIATGDIAPPPPQAGQGLAGQIAESQLGLGGAGNVIKDILFKEMGIGRSTEIVRTESLTHPVTGDRVIVPRTRTGEYLWDKAQPAPPEYTTQAIEMGEGAKGVMQYDKLRGFRPGMPETQIMQTAPPVMQKPIKEISLPLWVHPVTLESPGPGMSPEEAERQGYKRVSTEAKNRIDAAKGMREVLAKMGKLMEQVFPPKGGLRERMTGVPSRLFGAKTQYDPVAAQLESFINGTVAPIIRSFGEKGNLSETDVKRAINLMPKITDSADVAWGKFKNLLELIDNIQRSAIGGKPGLRLKPSGKTTKPSLKPKKEDPLGLR